MTKTELLAALQAVVEALEEDDSAEGSFQYAWSETPGQFDVNAAIRIGNSAGQGGMMLI